MTAPETGSSRRRYAPAVLVIVLALLGPLGVLLQTLVPGIAENVTAYALAVIVQELLLWMLPALFFRPWRIRRLGPRRQVLPVTVTAFFCGAAIQLFFSQLRCMLPGAGADASSVPMPSAWGEWALALPAMAVLPAVCEEAFFRGGLLPHLTDISRPVLAFGLSTLLFALMHGDAAGLPAHLAVSACCTLLMMSTGRLTAPVLLHMGFNTAAFLMCYLPETPLFLLAGLLPAALLLVSARSVDWKSGTGKRMGREDLVLTVLLLACMIARYLT